MQLSTFHLSRQLKGPFTLAIFAAILGAIFSADVMTIGNRQCKHPAISVRFQCNSSACNKVRYFRSCSKFVAPHCDFCNKIGQNFAVPPLHSFFWPAKMVEKTKKAEKSKKGKGIP